MRVFVDEGPPMAALLRAMGHGGALRPTCAACWTRSACRRTPPASHQGLIDPLSPRELDVLRLLGTHLDGPDIARQLFVSLNTVRTHTKNIYAKLGVNNRRAAVRRGEELDLMSARATARPGGQSSATGRRSVVQRARRTGRMATAPMTAQTPATAYSTP